MTDPSTLQNRSPLTYFVLTFALSVPFWIAGALTDFQILPGIPLSALGLLCMVGAASILVYRENGVTGVADLLKRSFDFKRVKAKVWYWPTFLIMPAIMTLSFIVMRLTGNQLPSPQFSFATPFILFAVFFIAAIGEELGWSGYAIDPLQDLCWLLHSSVRFFWYFRQKFRLAIKAANFIRADGPSSQYRA